MQCCHLAVTKLKNMNEMVKKAINLKENGFQQLIFYHEQIRSLVYLKRLVIKGDK